MPGPTCFHAADADRSAWRLARAGFAEPDAREVEQADVVAGRKIDVDDDRPSGDLAGGDAERAASDGIGPAARHSPRRCEARIRAGDRRTVAPIDAAVHEVVEVAGVDL